MDVIRPAALTPGMVLLMFTGLLYSKTDNPWPSGRGLVLSTDYLKSLRLIIPRHVSHG